MEDGCQVVAKLPTSIAGPSHYLICSENNFVSTKPHCSIRHFRIMDYADNLPPEQQSRQLHWGEHWCVGPTADRMENGRTLI